MSAPTITAHLTQFNNCLCEFITKMGEILPPDHSFQRLIKKYYSYYRKHEGTDARLEFVEEFTKYLGGYIKEVSTSDEGLFSEEEAYYPRKPIQLLKGMDFKVLWVTPDLTEGSKASIWKYLRRLYVVASHILKESHRTSQLMRKQKAILADMMEALRSEQHIKAEAERLNRIEAEKLAETGFNLESLKEIFGENNMILDMAKEIALDLNLPTESLSNPLEAIKLLFGQDGSRLQEIIAKVSTKLSQKIASGQINEQSLMSDAKQMNEKLTGKFKNIPGLPNLEEFSQKVASQIQKSMESRQASNTEAGTSVPTFADLTQTLRDNMAELGLNDAGAFQTQLADFLGSIGDASTATATSTTGETLEDEAELTQELADLKKQLN